MIDIEKIALTGEQQRYVKTVQNMCGLDDEFFAALVQNNPAGALYILRTVIRKSDLIFSKKPDIQKTIKDLNKKSIRLDLYCESENCYYDVEIQRKDRGAGSHRARYYSSLMDSMITVPGEDYDSLPDTYVIFITQNDIFDEGRPYYEIERIIKGSRKDFRDGSHILYVNGSYRGNDEFGRLVHDLRCKNPHDMYNGPLKDRAIFLKETEEGVRQMCQAIEKIADEKVETRNKEFAVDLIRDGEMNDEKIARLSHLTQEKVKEIRASLEAIVE